MAAESTSASRTFRRNSTKFFPSLQLSTLHMTDVPGSKLGYTVGRSYSCKFSESRSLYQRGCGNPLQLAYGYSSRAILHSYEIPSAAGQFAQSSLGADRGRRTDRPSSRPTDRI